MNYNIQTYLPSNPTAEKKKNLEHVSDTFFFNLSAILHDFNVIVTGCVCVCLIIVFLIFIFSLWTDILSFMTR